MTFLLFFRTGQREPVFLQLRVNLLVRQDRRIFSQHHDDIPALQYILVLSKAFPNQPLQAISRDRAFNELARYRQAQSGRLLRIVPEYCEICIAKAAIELKDALELRWPCQSLATVETMPGLCGEIRADW